MPTYTFDDGSTITSDGNGAVSSTSSTDSPYGYGWSTDTREAAKLNSYVPAPAGDNRPWYERVAEFGVTRAIDAHYGQAATQKGAAAASYAGQNGQTYANGTFLGGGGGLPLLLLGLVAAFLVAN